MLCPFRCQIYGVMMKKVWAIIICAKSDYFLQYLPFFMLKNITFVMATIGAVPLSKYHCSHCVEELLRVFICRRHNHPSVLIMKAKVFSQSQLFALSCTNVWSLLNDLHVIPALSWFFTSSGRQFSTKVDCIFNIYSIFSEWSFTISCS